MKPDTRKETAIRNNTVLVVDDDEGSCQLLKTFLKLNDFNVLLADRGRKAVDLLDRDRVALIISDHLMPEMDGFDLLKHSKTSHPDIPFIMITAFGSIETAVRAIKCGAFDYVQKPYELEDLLITVKRAVNFSAIIEENRNLREQLLEQVSFHSIVTKSQVMTNALRMAKKVAASHRTTVAIFGESGTGKEVLARAIHFEGESRSNRFVAVNCASVPPTLLESELFGYVKGAFTGADSDKDGKFGIARGGTILLDEIGDMPVEIQVKLLRVLEERTYERLGTHQPVSSDCRVIVSTHRDLHALVKNGSFREDLFHRVQVFPIFLPPLRERKEDIPLLVDSILGKLREDLGKSLQGISKKAMERLLDYHWPGNVRELKNCLERAAIVTEGDLIRVEHLLLGPDSRVESNPAGNSLSSPEILYNIRLNRKDLSLEAIIEQALKITLDRCGNNKSNAAKLLKINRKIYYRDK